MFKHFSLKSEFAQNVLKLVSGTAVAHVAVFILTPFITRMFSKESLGDWQIYISTVTTLGVVSSLKYEMAIVLPKDDREANAVTVLSLAALAVFSIVLTLFLFFFGEPLLVLLNAQVLQPYLYYISFGVFLFGLMQALQYVLVRRKRFGVLATNKIVQLVSTHILAVALGIFWPSFELLMAAQIAGYGLAAAAIFAVKPVSFRVTGRQLYQLVRLYKKFPTVNTSMVFLNTLSLQLPVFMLSRYFGSEIVALYSMANRVINIPLFMVGRSVQQVYFQNASEALHKGKDALMAVYKSTVKKLSLFALLPILVLLFFGPQLAKLYFGSGYMESGVYMQIITFWMFFQFINSPISSTFTIIDRQEIGFILILASLIIRFAAMLLFQETARQMLMALSVTAGLFYLFYNFSIYLLIKRIKE